MSRRRDAALAALVAHNGLVQALQLLVGIEVNDQPPAAVAAPNQAYPGAQRMPKGVFDTLRLGVERVVDE